jgi:signal peptidase II
VFTYQQRRWSVPLMVVAFVVTADQLSKWWVVQNLGPEILTRRIPVIGDWFNIIYTHNTGMAFSMLQNSPELLTATSILITTGAIYFYWTRLPSTRPLAQIVIGLIVGGGLGNLIDRIRLGYVVDFIQVGWFPVFNLADSAISCGAALLMLLFLREEQMRRGDEQQAVSA